MEANAFPKSQNIPPTVNLLLSASNISFISLKEVFSSWEIISEDIFIWLLIDYFGRSVGTILYI